MTYMDYIGELCERFYDEQVHMSGKLSLKNTFDPDGLKTAAGVDLAYWKQGDEECAVCCVVVIDIETHEIIEKQCDHGMVYVPYLPGYLAFRELPLFGEALKKLTVKPDIFFFDGNGYLHPRHMGIASQATFLLDEGVPSVGVAKSYYNIEGSQYVEPDEKAGSYTDITVYGQVFGRALRTHDGVRPVFVSAGNNITLDTATELTMRLVSPESHIPVPTRLADLETHVMREQLMHL